jgi:hypothetical protein
MKNEKNGQASWLLLAPMMLAATQGANALEWNVGAELGAEHHSNASKSSTNKESDLRQMVGVGLMAKEESRTLALEADYRALLERWQDDTQDDRDTITGFAQVAWKPAEFLRLYANNERHDLTIDSTEAKTTDNSDVRDTTEVGAELSFRFTAVDTVGIAGFYREVNYEEEGIDSERPGVLGFWRHDLSPVSSLSLFAIAEQAEFDGFDGEADRQSVYLSYQAALSQLRYQVDLGATRLELESNDLLIDEDDYTGELVRVSADFTHATHYLQVVISRELTDSSLGLEDSSTYGGGSFNPNDTNLDDFDVITQTQAYFNYRWNFALSWAFGASYRYSEEDYENLDSDEKRHDLELQLDYQATRTIGVGIYGGAETWKYDSAQTLRDKDEKFYAGVRLNWQLARQWGVTFGYEYEERDSDNAAAEYDNNIIYAQLRFLLR